jgi:hypothetical protein
MNWKLWAQGLAAAAIGGAAGGVSQAVTASQGQVGVSTAICAGVGALFTAVAYILKSPIQPGAPQIQQEAPPAPEQKE